MSTIRQFTNSFPGGDSLLPPGEETHIEQLQYLLLINEYKCTNLHNNSAIFNLIVYLIQVFLTSIWGVVDASLRSPWIGLGLRMKSVFESLFSPHHSLGQHLSHFILLINFKQILSKIFQCIYSYSFLPKQSVYSCDAITFFSFGINPRKKLIQARTHGSDNNNK